MRNLIVHRDSGYADRVRKYKIYCNSKVIGKIGNGESVSLDLPDGQHEVCFKIDWARSNKLLVNLKPSETSFIHVGSSLRRWKLILAAFYIVFIPHKYLWAKVYSN